MAFKSRAPASTQTAYERPCIAAADRKEASHMAVAFSAGTLRLGTKRNLTSLHASPHPRAPTFCENLLRDPLYKEPAVSDIVSEHYEHNTITAADRGLLIRQERQWRARAATHLPQKAHIHSHIHTYDRSTDSPQQVWVQQCGSLYVLPACDVLGIRTNQGTAFLPSATRWTGAIRLETPLGTLSKKWAKERGW